MVTVRAVDSDGADDDGGGGEELPSCASALGASGGGRRESAIRSMPSKADGGSPWTVTMARNPADWLYVVEDAILKLVLPP